ncbi:Uma2 family endonuclease [Calothrix sp. UHCC 0171]|uniref:Uma2 family endonuclease n=1 Tax=Calothrix sp. UHCC 0171 TaxID=3110245 RepID=UPI002B21BDC7|nr:Uma2 family endonuclease [Calothrix sp. UHCC 0171]MEA5571967.1 Uma2 family endonuclease [Calothrix sp. UHCC 0171]
MATVQTKRFTLAEYHKLTDMGFFHEDDHIELIRGEIIQMAAKGKAHETCLRRLWKELPKLVGDKATLQSQAPITLLSNSEPEPDFAIVNNRDDDYLATHPLATDILLVIEVSDSAFDYDKNVKLALYAEAGISNYWIFNLVESHLEEYSEPYQHNQDRYGYLKKQIILYNQTVNLPCFPDLSLDLSTIFPPQTNIYDA